MKKNKPWSDIEIHDTVLSYFKLLDDLSRDKRINKSLVYRHLSETHTLRSSKAFEFKFQNISAILYEEKLPYVDGLRPKGNYQDALKTSVLNYINCRAEHTQSSIDILTDKLKRLWCRNYLPVHGGGTGRYGLTLEYYLSIPQNSSKEPDFMGIELKTKHGNSLQTLFSRVPSRYLACTDKNQLIKEFGYFDEKRKRRSLYTSFNNTPDSLGFYLTEKPNKLVVNKKQLEILEYDDTVLEDAILSKHNETAFLSVSTKRLKNGKTGCRFDQLLYCKSPSLQRFMRMARNGNVYLNFTLSEKKGTIKDHGFLWRVPHDVLSKMYMDSMIIDLSKERL